MLFRFAGYSACVGYTKTIIHLSGSDSETVMDIYRAAKRFGQYPVLFTSTSVNTDIFPHSFCLVQNIEFS